ncbi:hypothetical protein AV521_11645 [Streptomyces sp. IMTB 2501]|nr:hypothetical protein AV521_11645 [Streptomyces sp. IMTB 2501]
MRHTVRRSCRDIEQATAGAAPAPRAAPRTARPGTAPGASPARPALAATRIPHKVPEGTADSGP